MIGAAHALQECTAAIDGHGNPSREKESPDGIGFEFAEDGAVRDETICFSPVSTTAAPPISAIVKKPYWIPR
jgi:hypothetical protein